MTSTVQSLEQAESIAATAGASRAIHYFKLPKKLAQSTGITHLGLVELISGEEMTCTARAENNQVRLGFELAKESLRVVRRAKGPEERLSTSDLSSDKFWGLEAMGMSKVRQLVLAAYGKIHNPGEADAEDFLGSHSVEIG